MNELWQRIIGWFRSNMPSENFPISNRQATEETLLNLESIIDMRLPEDFRVSYTLHDGSNSHHSFFENYFLLSLMEVGEKWTRKCMFHLNNSWLPQARDGSIKKLFWNRLWIPFTDNGVGDALCIDLDPASGGELGQIIEFSNEVGPIGVMATSFRAWLSEYARALEAGEYVFDYSHENLVKKS